MSSRPPSRPRGRPSTLAASSSSCTALALGTAARLRRRLLNAWRVVLLAGSRRVPEAFLPHDVPDRHVHMDLRAVRGPELHLPLRYFRAQGRDVAVVELVLNEPPDQGRLADGSLADEADFRLDPLGLGHRGHRPIRLGLLKGSAGPSSGRNLFPSAPLRDRDAPRPAVNPRP